MASFLPASSSLALAARLPARPVLIPGQVEEERALERERYVRIPKGGLIAYKGGRWHKTRG